MTDPQSISKEDGVLVFANMNVACFDIEGRQITELQKGLLVLWAEHAERLGYYPNGVIVRTQPTGRWQIFRNEDGWNYRSI